MSLWQRFKTVLIGGGVYPGDQPIGRCTIIVADASTGNLLNNVKITIEELNQVGYTGTDGSYEFLSDTYPDDYLGEYHFKAQLVAYNDITVKKYIKIGSNTVFINMSKPGGPSPPSNGNGGSCDGEQKCKGLTCYTDEGCKVTDFDDCLCKYNDGWIDTYLQYESITDQWGTDPRFRTTPYTEPVTVTVQITFKEQYTSDPIPNKTVYCNVKHNGVKLTNGAKTTNSGGGASWIINCNMGGEWRIYITSGAGSGYCRAKNECEGVIEIKVDLGTPTNLTIHSPSAVIVDEDFEISGMLTDATTNTGIGGRLITLEINDGSGWVESGKTGMTDPLGYYHIFHSFAVEGTFSIRVYFGGD